MIAALIAAAMTGIMPSYSMRPEPPLPDARPALWVVNDHDTVIYLFGTFHALDGKSDWFNDEVRTAFSASDELILETLTPDKPAWRPNQAELPGPGAVGPVAGSASFLSTSKMIMSAGRTRGMSTDKGADMILRRAAEHAGKSVSGLESFEFQIGMFTRMRPATAPIAPAAAPQVSATLAGILARLQDAWNRGDADSFAPMLEDMRSRSPDTYRMLFQDRNRRWAGWIARRMEQPGTVFVAVGAGHLVGRDSVQHRLAEAGIRSARIN